MRPASRLAPLLGAILVLSACGGGDGGGGGKASTTPDGTVTLYHPSGRVAATGTYAAGTTQRTGVWKEFFDQDGSPAQWEKTWRDGTWDAASPWREWNADGSTRMDWTDR